MDWSGIPLEEFGPQHEFGEDGKTTGRLVFPHGDGEGQRILMDLVGDVRHTYKAVLSKEDGERWERSGEVPVLRDGQRVYEPIRSLTLSDLPAVLDTLVVLEEEEDARLEEQRKARRRVMDRERRQRKDLGEW